MRLLHRTVFVCNPKDKFFVSIFPTTTTKQKTLTVSDLIQKVKQRLMVIIQIITCFTEQNREQTVIRKLLVGIFHSARQLISSAVTNPQQEGLQEKLWKDKV